LGLAGEVDAVSVSSDSAVEPADRYRSRAEAAEEMELALDDSGQLRSIGEELSLGDRQAADSQVDLDQGAAEVDELDLELEGLEGIEDLLETERGASVFDDGKERAQTPAPNQLDKPTSGELAGNVLDDELELDLADPLAASRSDGSAPPSVTYPTPGLALEPERARGAVDDPFADLDDDDLGGELARTEMGHEAGSSNDVASSQWQADSVLWDEAGTKLDLARAYIDMDDVDAARAILDEVVMEGTDEQRVAARAMLKELG
jgi:pilus assembly protein FimV